MVTDRQTERPTGDDCLQRWHDKLADYRDWETGTAWALVWQTDDIASATLVPGK